MRSVVIRKVGLFYESFENSAEILSYLMNYKLIKGRVGFPENAIAKVVNTLEDKKISYQILGEKEEIKDFKNCNKYNFYLAKSKNKIKIDRKIDQIMKKLDSLDEGSLCELLEKVIKVIDEYE